LKAGTWDFVITVEHRGKLQKDKTSTYVIDVQLDPCESPQGPGILKTNENPTMTIDYYLRTHDVKKNYPLSITYEPAHCVSSKYMMEFDWDKTEKNDKVLKTTVAEMLIFEDASITIDPVHGDKLVHEGTYIIKVYGESFTKGAKIEVEKTVMIVTVNLIDPCKNLSATSKPKVTKNGVHHELSYTLRDKPLVIEWQDFEWERKECSSSNARGIQYPKDYTGAIGKLNPKAITAETYNKDMSEPVDKPEDPKDPKEEKDEKIPEGPNDDKVIEPRENRLDGDKEDNESPPADPKDKIDPKEPADPKDPKDPAPANTKPSMRWVIDSDEPSHAGVFVLEYTANYLGEAADSIKV